MKNPTKIPQKKTPKLVFCLSSTQKNHIPSPTFFLLVLLDQKGLNSYFGALRLKNV